MATGGGHEDLWTLASQQGSVAETKKGDANVVFVGAKQAGKSTLVGRYVAPDREDTQPNPTLGLEYRFARKSTMLGMEKEVVHLWEAGSEGKGDTCSLAHVPLTRETIETTVVVVVADLSKPGDVWSTLQFWREKIGARVTQCFSELRAQGSNVPERLIQRARTRMAALSGEESHPDSDRVHLCGIPLVAVCTKYDKFMDEEPEMRKVMARSLRYLCHISGMSLVYVSSQHKALVSPFRSVLNHYAMGTPPPKHALADPSKPLLLLHGADRLESIGKPPMVKAHGGHAVSSTQALWQAALASHYAPTTVDDDDDTRVDASEFAEPAIDSMRAQKAQALSVAHREFGSPM